MPRLVAASEVRGFDVILIVLRRSGLRTRSLFDNQIGAFPFGLRSRQGKKIPDTDANQAAPDGSSSYTVRIEASDMAGGNTDPTQETTRYMLQAGPAPPPRDTRYYEKQLLCVAKPFNHDAIATISYIQVEMGVFLGRCTTPLRCMQGFEILYGAHATDRTQDVYIALNPRQVEYMISEGILSVAYGTFPDLQRNIPEERDFTRSDDSRLRGLIALADLEFCGPEGRAFAVPKGTQVDRQIVQQNEASSGTYKFCIMATTKHLEERNLHHADAALAILRGSLESRGLVRSELLWYRYLSGLVGRSHRYSAGCRYVQASSAMLPSLVNICSRSLTFLGINGDYKYFSAAAYSRRSGNRCF
ncbi:hypothetical protein DOTSEDRAFT_35423 [Dothistroma septosporum NZE10]|uniref:Uncharacterized protein n=1 Tax=Dothistroma septosporum (strain NZE10 / CBS 128990) TaxID=675120 RepID=M2YM52_DOTSN|nr:hypothetical protein DOTSEDRAFT_35423 [Dothistroma septosporum NZE10]